MAIGYDAAAELLGSLGELVRSARSVSQHSRDVGATGTALGVLKALQPADARPSDVAAALRVGPSVISRALAPLEQQGLVERKVDPVDGRAALLGLTALGQDRVAEVQRIFATQLCQTLEDWTDEQAVAAAAVLTRLGDALNDYQQPENHRRQLSQALLPTGPDDRPASPLNSAAPTGASRPASTPSDTEEVYA